MMLKVNLMDNFYVHFNNIHSLCMVFMYHQGYFHDAAFFCGGQDQQLLQPSSYIIFIIFVLPLRIWHQHFANLQRLPRLDV